ncbi:hypothetical protein GBAR_LOCUS25826 [Geodia barretti]|uniref:Uncharacterized protein n=1 Tax=Geodia barretti TaxID=519541 RepID=A0AA35X623_GEOBA|nr:hypothetical protein GBAR_LOCUS25826 [Geodia barretti]
MAIKVALLAVSALIAVAAANPYDPIAVTTEDDLYCNPAAKYTITIGIDIIELSGCSKGTGADLVICIKGLPPQCTSTPGQCYVYTWSLGASEVWVAKICKTDVSPCFCVEDETSGAKTCVPDNCDASRGTNP